MHIASGVVHGISGSLRSRARASATLARRACSRAATRPPARTRSRKHPHHAGSSRRVRAAGDVVFDRQGLLGPASSCAEGVLSRAASRFRCCTSTRPTSSGEMIEFRNAYTRSIGARLIVHTNNEAIADGTQPFAVGTQRCCGLLKTKALLDALEAGQFDAAFGGARRDEERSRAKERVFSLRDDKGQWDPKRQRPELWHLLNSRIGPGESIRVFPLSNWTELDVWHYIDVEQHSRRPAVLRQGARRDRARTIAGRGRAAVRAAAPRRPRRARACAACGRWAVRPARARCDPTPTRCRRSSRSSSASASRSGSFGSSTTIRTGRWRSRSAKAISDARSPAHLHRRKRGRWEEHAHRTACCTTRARCTRIRSDP